MENHLYWISDIVYVMVLAIILWHSYVYRDSISPLDKVFRRLLSWCVFFCFQDAVWYITGLKATGFPALFFASSTIFHVSTIVSAYFWLDFVLIFLRKYVRYPKGIRVFAVVVISMQLILVVRNFFFPTIFSISEDNVYVAERFRMIAMLAPYLIFVVAGSVMAFFYLKNNREDDGKHFPVLMFVLAPIAFGILQLQFTGCPFNSMSFFIGCCIIHIFIAARERNERLKVVADMDGLTKVFNRHACEMDAKRYKDVPIDEDMIVYSIDVNGLKQVNDNMGQDAGNELILGAAHCISNAFAGNGKIYRYGGDEFMVLALYSGDGMFYKNKMQSEASRWKGEKVHELALSVGFAERRNFPTSDIAELKSIADNMMRLDKSNYYLNKGVDRRKLREAFGMVCSSYSKILKLNLTMDTFEAVQIDPNERNSYYGYSETHSLWLKNYVKLGWVYLDDAKKFGQQTDLETLRNYFKKGKKSFSMRYRRKTSRGLEHALMEILRTSEYTDENQVVFLYVKSVGGSSV